MIKSSLFILAFLAAFSLPTVAQDSIKVIPTKYSLINHPVKPNPYPAFKYPLPKLVNYADPGLNQSQIARSEKDKTMFTRVYNAITNHAHEGFIPNITGLKRSKPKPKGPGF